jgi:alkylation response protein AidB-like acyl-CoA dehydrogenase
MLRKTVTRFVNGEIAHHARKDDLNPLYALENTKSLAKLKILGMRVPQKYGGSGRSLFDSVIVLEEVAKADASTAVILQVQHNASPVYIMMFGEEKIKAKFLPQLVSGKILFSMAQTEPNVGSSLNELTTTATPSGDYYVVNGNKCMITMGRNADVHLVYVRFEDDNSIGCLLIEKGTPGFYQGGHEDFLGLKGLDSGELVFNGCKVPRENVLLKGNGSLRKMLQLFNGTRVGLASISLGISEAAFEESLKYAKSRTVSRKLLIDHQGIRWKLADMAVKIECMRQLVYSAARDISEEGFPGILAASAAKLVCSDGAIDITNMAMTVFGGYGYSKEFPIERYLRDARGAIFLGGMPAVLRNAIGSRLKAVG